MEIFSNKEKNDLLQKIGKAKSLEKIYDENEREIIDRDLYPKGYVDIISKLMMPDQYLCEITPLGKAFLSKGGYIAIEEEEDHERVIQKLKNEILILTKEKLRYEKSIRWRSLVSFIIGLITGILGLMAALNLFR
jgi:hypothetical protein